MHKLDKLASKIVLSKKQWCDVCWDKATEVHHIFSRKNRSVRWYLPNIVPVCRKCHTDLHNQLRGFYKNKPYYDELQRLANTIDKNPDEYWEDYLKTLL